MKKYHHYHGCAPDWSIADSTSCVLCPGRVAMLSSAAEGLLTGSEVTCDTDVLG